MDKILNFWVICNSSAADCGHPHQEMFVITWSLFWITWMKPAVREAAWKNKRHLNRGLGSIVNSVELGSRDHASRLPVMFSFTCTKRTFHPVLFTFLQQKPPSPPTLKQGRRLDKDADKERKLKTEPPRVIVRWVTWSPPWADVRWSQDTQHRIDFYTNNGVTCSHAITLIQYGERAWW